ncbi:MAG: LacI family DNA-binding transcriptional regulator [Lachnospiraceae bacterium]|nr:LacI family DNA-binding transcriptional regulator [Lachnospiraceae bacterium]
MAQVKAVRLSDIAERIGVSTVTVSKALSGQKGMSEELRQRIRETAQEMGYVPNASRRGSGEKKQGFRIGLLVAEHYLDKYVSFYAHLQQLVAAEAAAKNCSTLLEGITYEHEMQSVRPDIITDALCDGLILIGKVATPYLTMLDHIGIPTVYLDFSDRTKDADAVVSDSFYGSYMLTNYLFSLGHVRIGFVGTLLATSSITDRYLGYVRALMEHEIPVRPDWILPDRDPETGGQDADRFFPIPAELPTAFVCNNDFAAAMLIRKLRAQGVSVPEEISVVGYDNFIYPGLCDLGITTWDVDTREMAKRAVHNLLHKLRGESYRRGIVVIGGRLIEKESAQPIG